MAIRRADFTGRFHRIVEVGNMIYLAGVTARNAHEDEDAGRIGTARQSVGK